MRGDAVIFYGKTQDKNLGTIYVEAMRITDKATPCSNCGKSGVEIVARLSCTRTVHTYSAFVCAECKPLFARNVYNWYCAGTVALEGVIHANRN